MLPRSRARRRQTRGASARTTCLAAPSRRGIYTARRRAARYLPRPVSRSAATPPPPTCFSSARTATYGPWSRRAPSCRSRTRWRHTQSPCRHPPPPATTSARRRRAAAPPLRPRTACATPPVGTARWRPMSRGMTWWLRWQLRAPRFSPSQVPSCMPCSTVPTLFPTALPGRKATTGVTTRALGRPSRRRSTCTSQWRAFGRW
mmetsp:Transcript_25191/g.65392  ORF Transcript_25191/g.65392 Transcript_25191/m.65392 type:complete len:203 (-) Transcript_25191:630-1238(-)